MRLSRPFDESVNWCLGIIGEKCNADDSASIGGRRQILSIGDPRELMPKRRERARCLGFVLFVTYNQSSLLPGVAFS
jgi:hypothetical protein